MVKSSSINHILKLLNQHYLDEFRLKIIELYYRFPNRFMDYDTKKLILDGYKEQGTSEFINWENSLTEDFYSEEVEKKYNEVLRLIEKE